MSSGPGKGLQAAVTVTTQAAGRAWCREDGSCAVADAIAAHRFTALPACLLLGTGG